MIDNRDTAQMRVMDMIQRMGIEEEEPLQGRFENIQQQKPNNTGLPDNLKSGVENLSGFSMDDVRVHYNSDKPAQIQAHAYTQGSDIHVASGQEKHLPHEAWHAVQQMQGRVQPTMQMQGVNVNDNEGLEKEADSMGWQAVQGQTVQRKLIYVGDDQISEGYRRDVLLIQDVYNIGSQDERKSLSLGAGNENQFNGSLLDYEVTEPEVLGRDTLGRKLIGGLIDVTPKIFIQNDGELNAAPENGGILLDEKQPSGTYVSINDAATPFQLAHELIHAHHNATDPHTVTENTVIIRIDATGEEVAFEEARTVGLGEYKDDELTENAFRASLKIGKRTRYNRCE